jgi:FkbM family methyltransferase
MIFSAYKRYPFVVPPRVKFFNLFRYFFRIGILEKFLATRTSDGRSSYWKRMVPPLYFYPAGSFRVVVRDGITFRLDLSKQLDHSIYFSLVKDVAWHHLLQLIRTTFHVIDVGANIGYLTLQFAARCRSGRVYAFEPDSDTFSKLKQNVGLNEFNNIELFHTALGAFHSKAQLFKLYESNPGANRILSHNPDSSVGSETVEIQALDSFESRLEIVHLIKIDVEGFELFVLQGAARIINRFRPILFVELIDINLEQQGCRGRQVIDWLKAIDYIILDARTMKPLETYEQYYTDIICFPDSTTTYA